MKRGWRQRQVFGMRRLVQGLKSESRGKVCAGAVMECRGEVSRRKEPGTRDQADYAVMTSICGSLGVT